MGFGNADTVTVGGNGFRIPGYYHFDPFDSLSIHFTARRLAIRPTFDHLLINVGPPYYVSDSLSALQKDFSIPVRSSDLAKAHYAALTFIVQDPETSLMLSQLRVVGWGVR